jgi:hypothetical protein
VNSHLGILDGGGVNASYVFCVSLFVNASAVFCFV